MHTTLLLKERTAAEAEHAFDEHLRFKLHEFLKNECILTQAGIERVMPVLLEIYINGIHGMQVQFDIQIPPNSAYAPFEGVITQYAKEISPGFMNTLSNATALASFHMLQATARHLAALDDKAHKRQPH
ncbi:hypothetical protein [Pseudomonas sp. S1(2024)]|uniref:hypothetical protein n=1 Tax=Pseudomonas sp. S1(2024) TaxID=3390191 RepID=UPI00397938CE